MLAPLVSERQVKPGLEGPIVGERFESRAAGFDGAAEPAHRFREQINNVSSGTETERPRRIMAPARDRDLESATESGIESIPKSAGKPLQKSFTSASRSL